MLLCLFWLCWFKVFSDSSDSGDQSSSDFDFCCCPNRGVDLEEDYKQNDTGYCDEYIGVI